MRDRPTRGQILLIVGCLIVVGVVPLIIDNPFYLNLLIMTCLAAGMAGAWNILGGYAGQLSLGHSAFFGIGAYISTLLYLRLGISPWLGMLAGGIAAAIASLVIGGICFRLRGPFYTLATIAFAEVVRIVAIYWRDFTEGSLGLLIPFRPSVANFMFSDRTPYLYISIGLVLLTVGVSVWIERSKFGLYFRAIGEEESAAASLGVDVFGYKLAAAGLSGFLVGIMGVFYAQYVLFIEPHSELSLQVSIQMAVMCMIGGMGTAVGPVLGAALLTPLSEILRSQLGGTYSGLHLLIYGVLLIAVVLAMPRGLIARLGPRLNLWIGRLDLWLSRLVRRPVSVK